MPLVYLDTSVLLAHVHQETRRPPAALFDAPLIASRLLDLETWNRIHGRGAADALGGEVTGILARVSFVEMAPPVLRFARGPWPTPVRTLDAIHLGTILFLQNEGADVRLATYDSSMASGARALKIPIIEA